MTRREAMQTPEAMINMYEITPGDDLERAVGASFMAKALHIALDALHEKEVNSRGDE